MYLQDIFTVTANLAGCRRFPCPRERWTACRWGCRLSAGSSMRRRSSGAAAALEGGRAMSHDNHWEAVIGLEVHAQLKTATKTFCR